MGTYFAYARVSTPRQGEKGVSLQEQRDAIERYSQIHGIAIGRWFEERESASHTGRTAFTEMLRLLRTGKAQGVVIHKIDRSARNLHDWADVGKLVDAGIQVHFATENVDLKTTSGRLSADIQAVVAAHYSRNLREEVKKGLYGRLKQGIYPFRAPLGYLDNGTAEPKTLDPVRAPLVREAFNAYASGQASLPTLASDMHERGLRNFSGGTVSISGFAKLLKNPFYIGLMKIAGTGQIFEGKHEPLVSPTVFQQVQEALEGKRVDRKVLHSFVYSRIAKCASCGYSLIGELKKGHVYYRCHNRPFKKPAVCPPTSVRQEHIDKAILIRLAEVDLSDAELAIARKLLDQHRSDATRSRATRIGTLRLQLDSMSSRLAKASDLVIDGTLEKALFRQKQDEIVFEQARIKSELADLENGTDLEVRALGRTVELAKSPSIQFRAASAAKKRELVKALLSNLTVSQKNVTVTLAVPFSLITMRGNHTECGHYRGTCRTRVPRWLQRFINVIIKLAPEKLQELSQAFSPEEEGDSLTYLPIPSKEDFFEGPTVKY